MDNVVNGLMGVPGSELGALGAALLLWLMSALSRPLARSLRCWRRFELKSLSHSTSQASRSICPFFSSLVSKKDSR
jgi:hypothetical protein